MRGLSIDDLHWRRAKVGKANDAIGVDAEVVGDARVGGVQRQVGEPAIGACPAHVAVGREVMVELRAYMFLEGESKAGRAGKIASYRCLSPGPIKLTGVAGRVGQREQVSLYFLSSERQRLEWYPDVSSAHGYQNGGAVALKSSASLGRAGIELCRHKDGAAFSVCQQVIARFGIEEETIVACPFQYLQAAPTDDRDIQRLDLDPFENGGAGCRSCSVKKEGLGYGMRFDFQALQRPGPSLLDAEWNGW